MKQRRKPAHNRIVINEGDVINGCTYLREEPSEVDGCGQRRRVAVFRCRCGTEFSAKINHVRYGVTRSCGCYMIKRIKESNTKHGMKDTSEYNIWCKMRDRCYRENDAAYKNYGGRGISVCDRWMNSFENFFADMGKRPSEEYSIDRINNNGNYEPSNCRWATKQQQRLNKRGNRHITYNGETKVLSEWCEQFGLPYGMAYRRVVECGWPLERAFSPEKAQGRNKYNSIGKSAIKHF